MGKRNPYSILDVNYIRYWSLDVENEKEMKERRKRKRENEGELRIPQSEKNDCLNDKGLRDLFRRRQVLINAINTEALRALSIPDLYYFNPIVCLLGTSCAEEVLHLFQAEFGIVQSVIFPICQVEWHHVFNIETYLLHA